MKWLVSPSFGLLCNISHPHLQYVCLTGKKKSVAVNLLNVLSASPQTAAFGQV